MSPGIKLKNKDADKVGECSDLFVYQSYEGGNATWDIVYPFGMYYVVIVMVMILLQDFLGTSVESYSLRQAICSFVTIPIMYFWFYRTDNRLYGRETLWDLIGKQKERRETRWKEGSVSLVLILVISLMFGFSLNNIISMTPLMKISAGYGEASESFYAAGFMTQLVSSALLTPILEELVFRGILYQRMRELFPEEMRTMAMVLSAALFGVVHFHVVQFVYAFLLGIVFTLFMERAGHLYAAVLGHIAVNFLAILRTQFGWFGWTTDKSVAAWSVSICVFLIACVLLVFYVKGKETTETI